MLGENREHRQYPWKTRGFLATIFGLVFLAATGVVIFVPSANTFFLAFTAVSFFAAPWAVFLLGAIGVFLLLCAGLFYFKHRKQVLDLSMRLGLLTYVLLLEGNRRVERSDLLFVEPEAARGRNLNTPPPLDEKKVVTAPIEERSNFSVHEEKENPSQHKFYLSFKQALKSEEKTLNLGELSESLEDERVNVLKAYPDDPGQTYLEIALNKLKTAPTKYEDFACCVGNHLLKVCENRRSVYNLKELQQAQKILKRFSSNSRIESIIQELSKLEIVKWKYAAFYGFCVNKDFREAMKNLPFELLKITKGIDLFQKINKKQSFLEFALFCKDPEFMLTIMGILEMNLKLYTDNIRWLPETLEVIFFILQIDHEFKKNLLVNRFLYAALESNNNLGQIKEARETILIFLAPYDEHEKNYFARILERCEERIEFLSEKKESKEYGEGSGSTAMILESTACLIGEPGEEREKGGEDEAEPGATKKLPVLQGSSVLPYVSIVQDGDLPEMEHLTME